MFGFGLPTSYFSPVNYDMTNGSAWSSMNLHANQNWADLIARQSLYQVPMYNFTGFSQYPTMFGNNSYLCDPMWTVGQMAANGFFNNCGNMGMQFPWMQGNQSSSSSSSSSTTDKEEEARMNEEYKALKELLNTYKNTNKNINSSLKTKIETALKKGGKIEEKLEALQEAYNAIPKSSLRKTMALLDTKDTGFRQDLEAAGYKFGMSDYSFNSGKEKAINNTITKLENEIDKINQDDSAPTEFRNVLENNDILRLVSYWNDKHESDNIIDSVIDNLPSNTTKKKEAFNNYVQPLVEALLNKASDVASASCFDDDTIDALDTITKSLRDSKNKGINDLNNLKTSFEKLYVMLRQMEALRINSEIQAKYSFLNAISSSDKDFINDDIIVKDTKADLEAEGLSSVSEDIADDINVIESDGIEDMDETEEPEDPATIQARTEKRVADLILDGVLTETSIKYGDKDVYEETTKTGDRDYKRVFIIEDGKVKELGNAKVSNGELVYIDNTNKTVTKSEVTTDSIKDAYNKVKKAEEKAEADAKTDADAQKNGKYVWELLKDWTSKADTNLINNALDKVDSSNILSFLDGVYAEAGCHHEGLFEKLEDDTTVSMVAKKKLINDLLAKANEMGMSNTDAYLDLKQLLEEHEIAYGEDAKNFNQYHHGWGAWLLGFHTNYKEEIDKRFEKLYNEMKAKAA